MTLLQVEDGSSLTQEGWLFDDASVFGSPTSSGLSGAVIGSWSPEQVASRVDAKCDSYGAGCEDWTVDLWRLDGEGWWAVAEVAAGCEELLRTGPGAAVDLCMQTFTTAWGLSQRLPIPPRSVRSQPSWPAWCASLSDQLDQLTLIGAELDMAAGRLVRALAEDGVTDPFALAGWVWEAMVALAVYLRAHRLLRDQAAGELVSSDGGPCVPGRAWHGRRRYPPRVPASCWRGRAPALGPPSQAPPQPDRPTT